MAVDNAMSFIVWLKYFLQEQAILDNENSKLKSLGDTTIIEQDNTSAILLERNGKRSSTKRTQHINIRYFYVTDKLKTGEITDIVYKLTEEMDSDTLTKGLQGKLFLKHCSKILGLENINEYKFYRKYKNSGVDVDNERFMSNDHC